MISSSSSAGMVPATVPACLRAMARLLAYHVRQGATSHDMSRLVGGSILFSVRWMVRDDTGVSSFSLSHLMIRLSRAFALWSGRSFGQSALSASSTAACDLVSLTPGFAPPGSLFSVCSGSALGGCPA